MCYINITVKKKKEIAKLTVAKPYSMCYTQNRRMTEELFLLGEDLLKPVTETEFLAAWEKNQKKTLAAEWKELDI